MATLTTSYQLIVNQKIGTVSGSGVSAKDLYLRIYAKYTSQDIANNKSTVFYKSALYATGSGYFYTYNTTTKSLSGTGATSTSASAQGTYYGGQEVTLSEISGTVSHNSSTGAASVSMSATWVSTPWSISGSASGSASLPTIPRASSITSAGNVTLGNACNIKWTPANTSFKYKIKFALGSWNYTTGFISPGTTGAYTYTGYTIPNTSDLLDDIPSSTTGTMTATLYTYNSSGTQIGSASSKTFTVTVPNGVVPAVGTITLDPADINGQNILVQGKNKLTISVSGCAAGTGSSIKSYTFSGPGISSTTTSTSVTSSSTISNTGTLTYTVTVTDNRGRTASKSATISCYAWAAPSITLSSAYRVATSTGTTENDSGAYVRCTYNLSYASVNSTNDITVKIYYKKNSASSWSSAIALTDSKNTSGSYTLSNIDAASTYTVYATITDNYSGSSNSDSVTVFSTERILNIRPKGAGMAFGKMADTDDVLDSKWPIRSDEPEQTMKNLTFKGTNTISSITNDTTSNWGSQGNLATVFYNATGKITDQPSQYGFLLNLTAGPDSSEVHQLWATQSGGNILHRGGNASGWNGSWKTVFDSSNYTSYVSPKPTTLYSGASGGTINLLQSTADFSYLEIFYTDNGGNGHSSTRVYSPNGKKLDLSIIEASDGTVGYTYIRRTLYTISADIITPYAENLGLIQFTPAETVVKDNYIDAATDVFVSSTTNYIRIIRVLGYK